LGLYLLWFEKGNQDFSLNIAFILGLINLGGFLLNVGVRKLYSGTLSDPNGVPPIFGKIDANLFVFSLAFVILISGFVLYRMTYFESN
jgi:hypothetical protein